MQTRTCFDPYGIITRQSVHQVRKSSFTNFEIMLYFTPRNFKRLEQLRQRRGQLIQLPIDSSFTSILKQKQVSYLLLHPSIECLPLRGHDKNLKYC